MSLDEELGFRPSRPKQGIIAVAMFLLVCIAVWASIRNGFSATWPLLLVVMLILSVGVWMFTRYSEK